MGESSHSADTERGAWVADHPYPRPALRRLTGLVVTAGLAAAAFGVIGLVVVGVALGLPLLPVMALFLAVLIVPLLLLTVLHPAITVYERGLWLQPLVWRGVWLPWEAITRLEDHTLIRRGKEKDRHVEHFGKLIVVDDGLPRVYVVVGIMAGLGTARAFGISTLGHADYKALLNAIQRHKPR